jgi:hypothetical protein
LSFLNNCVIKKIKFTGNTFSTIEFDFNGKQILDGDFNEILNTYNNTDELNFWFTRNNNYFIQSLLYNPIITVITEKKNGNEELEITYLETDSKIPDKIDFVAEQHVIINHSIIEGINSILLDINNIIKEIYLICFDENNNKIDAIDDIGIYLNGHGLFENINKEYFLIHSQINKKNIVDNVYYIPFYIGDEKYEKIGTMNSSRIDNITLKFTSNKKCNLKIIVVNNNIYRYHMGLSGFLYVN